MRERLIELLRDTFNYTKGVCIDFDEAVEINADYLIDNGVVVLPCKVGDVVYIVDKVRSGHWEEDKYIIDDEGQWQIYEKDFNLVMFAVGREYFLTKEEAERALKGGAE